MRPTSTNNLNLSFVSLRAENPDRPVDWRWGRGTLLCDRNAPILSGEDPDVVKVWAYLRDLKSGMGPEKLASRHPDLFTVATIHSEAGATRHTLEALVMAGLSNEEIAERFGWTDPKGPARVGLYCSLKFDIRPRLKFDAFIYTKVLQINEGATIWSEERVWKLLAWIGNRRKIGSALLDAYFDMDAMPLELRQWFQAFIDQQLTRKTVRGMLRFDPLSNPNMIELLRVYQDARKLELASEAQGADVALSESAKIQATLIQSLQLTTSQISKALPSGIEPRANDVVRMEMEAALQEQVNSVLSHRVKSETKALPSE